MPLLTARAVPPGAAPPFRAEVRAQHPLTYAEGADARLDRPAHVRAASALIPCGQDHLIVQDDTLFLGRLRDGVVSALALPSPDGVRQFDTTRGNKHQKPDLEAGMVWSVGDQGWAVALGSGSLPARERILVAPLTAPEAARFLDAAPLYACLRAALPDGTELNVEGAWQAPDGTLQILQRGNGRGAVDARLVVEGAWLDDLLTGACPTAPVLRGGERWSLGTLDGVRLTFTDGLAAPGPEGGWFFSATAEDSPDAIDDGPVAGSVVGWAAADGSAAWWAPLQDPSGSRLPLKLEGLSRLPSGDFLGVVDADDPVLPSLLLHIHLLAVR